MPSATVETERRKFDWICGGRAHDWESKGAKQQANWLTHDARSRKESLTLIAETPLVWGTNWDRPWRWTRHRKWFSS